MRVFFSIVLVATFFIACNENKSNNVSNGETDSTEIIEESPDLLDTTGGKGVFFVNLKDSDEVVSPLNIYMGVNGMEVEKAGEVHSLMGHHHLIIDGSHTPLGETVPADDMHIHFGQGQTETDQELTPGYHTLTLQFANGIHASYGAKWSKTITVLVKNSGKSK
ncbi:MAG: DUF4399 domain-containing protein [Flavobacteriales bacterium]|nr:DUF4399 domain-containing protein [Flavobacteriales bacterium]